VSEPTTGPADAPEDDSDIPMDVRSILANLAACEPEFKAPGPSGSLYGYKTFSGWSVPDWLMQRVRKALRDGQAEARADALAEVAAAVEGLIEEAGGRCVKPDDYDPAELNVCVAHSELMGDDGCEDQPRVLLAVLRLLKEKAS
jgi:hypothetical protein